jgi:hypothetical protein
MGMKEKQDLGGIDPFIAFVCAQAGRAMRGHATQRQCVHAIADQVAYLRLGDLWDPLRFLSQLAGEPPMRFGTTGFDPSVVDDQNPARHYLAFVWVGYWLPGYLAMLVLWMWEILGFVRYGGVWSWPDIRSGQIGIRHGRLVRRYGVVVLPGLIAAEVAGRPAEFQ